ncbi:FAD:protein FMN transferase [Streptomyces sp. NPDC086091]|uniref:FAD:protein FMN transferase n=1 Tax=Streptomyces sp. NPDC086091 TaxID=3365751 RepID=UPI00381F810A
MRRVEQVMGFPVSLRVDDPGAGADVGAAVDAVFAWLREADERFSPFKPGSEVSRYGRGDLPSARVGADLAEILRLCEHYRAATGGAFDAWLPGRGFDPCAVVKGWAVQRAAGLLDAAGARRYCLNAGGDVVVAGGPWRIGVRHPETADRLCAVVELGEECEKGGEVAAVGGAGGAGGAAGLRAVATSARYERGDHILDARSGRAATELVSVTVVAPTLTEADAVATAAFAMGAAGVEWAAGVAGCEVFAVDAGLRVRRSAGFPGGGG